MESRAHWDGVYGARTEAELSWHQDDPAISFALMNKAGLNSATSVIDIGGGTSRIVDRLLAAGLCDVSVLDLSENALLAARQRLGPDSDKVTWITADVTRWRAPRTYDLWHDRAVFHFLTGSEDRAAYLRRLEKSLSPAGHAIIATFALDGPEKCSGLPVVRYSPDTLAATLGEGFERVAHQHHEHRTPWGSPQAFQYSLFRKRP